MADSTSTPVTMTAEPATALDFESVERDEKHAAISRAEAAEQRAATLAQTLKKIRGRHGVWTWEEIDRLIDAALHPTAQPAQEEDGLSRSRLPSGHILICQRRDGPCIRVPEGCSPMRCLGEEEPR